MTNKRFHTPQPAFATHSQKKGRPEDHPILAIQARSIFRLAFQRHNPRFQRDILFAGFLRHSTHRVKFVAGDEIAVGHPAVKERLHRCFHLGLGTLRHAHRIGHQFADIVEEFIARLHVRLPFVSSYMAPSPVRFKGAGVDITRRGAENGPVQQRRVMSYIPFPPVTPEVFSVEIFGLTLSLRWYALAYIAGLMAGWWVIRHALRSRALWATPPMREEQLERLLTWVIAGVILGGRLGYVLFYQAAFYLANPWQILRVWEGGMSFHGGFLGVTVAGLVFCYREKISALTTGDLFAMVAPIGLFLGRLANFINAELWGRPTNLPWGVAFPGDAAQLCDGVVGVCARHPSQLYEAVLEGLILGAILLWGAWRGGWLARPGRIMGLFIAGYGLVRFAVEFVRQPDAQFITPGNPLGLAWQVHGWGLTQGQALSLPMIAVGLWFLGKARPA